MHKKYLELICGKQRLRAEAYLQAKRLGLNNQQCPWAWTYTDRRRRLSIRSEIWIITQYKNIVFWCASEYMHMVKPSSKMEKFLYHCVPCTNKEVFLSLFTAPFTGDRRTTTKSGGIYSQNTSAQWKIFGHSRIYINRHSTTFREGTCEL